MSIDELEKLKQSICEQSGHVYSGPYNGWKDNSYIKNNNRRRNVLSIHYSQKSRNEIPVYIRFTRVCDRCGKIDTIRKIPDIVLEQEFDVISKIERESKKRKLTRKKK